MDNAGDIASANLTEENEFNESHEFHELVFLLQTRAGHAIIVFLSLQGALIVCANSLVFVLFGTTRYLRTQTNYCLASLAASDLLAGAVSLPMVLACNATFQLDICTSMDLCQRFLSVSTILHLLIATAERYFKITRPFRYKILVTKRRVIALLTAVWFFSMAASFVQLSWILLPVDDNDKIAQLDLGYAVFCLTALVLFPFLVIAFIDGRIFYFIHKERKMRQALTTGKLVQPQQKRNKKKQDRKAAVIYLAMTLTFVMGWFPYFIFTLLTDLGYIASIPLAVSTMFLFFKFSTALINPLLYTFFKADFRKALRTALAREHCSDGSNEVISSTV